MSEPAQPQHGTFYRAEAGARRIVMTLGLGFAAYVVGGFLTNGILTRLAERTEGIESEALAFVLFWLIERLWLFLVLPATGWAMGRFLEVRPFAFAATAALTGEILGALLITASGGLEMLVPTVADGVARGVTLLAGIALTQLATTRGLAGAARAQALADTEAAARKAEYDEFARRSAELAEKKDPAPSPEPPAEPPK